MVRAFSVRHRQVRFIDAAEHSHHRLGLVRRFVDLELLHISISFETRILSRPLFRHCFARPTSCHTVRRDQRQARVQAQLAEKKEAKAAEVAAQRASAERRIQVRVRSHG